MPVFMVKTCLEEGQDDLEHEGLFNTHSVDIHE